jgi:hypothetical protein
MALTDVVSKIQLKRLEGTQVIVKTRYRKFGVYLIWLEFTLARVQKMVRHILSQKKNK